MWTLIRTLIEGSNYIDPKGSNKRYQICILQVWCDYVYLSNILFELYTKSHQTYRTIHHTSNNANTCTKCKASVKGSSPSHVSIVLSTTQPRLRQPCYEIHWDVETMPEILLAFSHGFGEMWHSDMISAFSRHFMQMRAFSDSTFYWNPLFYPNVAARKWLRPRRVPTVEAVRFTTQ